jgi:hypothetical protein
MPDPDAAGGIAADERSLQALASQARLPLGVTSADELSVADLYYDLIIPCGISGEQVTSMERLLSRPVSLEEVVKRVAIEFASSW